MRRKSSNTSRLVSHLADSGALEKVPAKSCLKKRSLQNTRGALLKSTQKLKSTKEPHLVNSLGQILPGLFLASLSAQPRWFCEVVLWTPWVHQGRVRAKMLGKKVRCSFHSPGATPPNRFLENDSRKKPGKPLFS